MWRAVKANDYFNFISDESETKDDDEEAKLNAAVR